LAIASAATLVAVWYVGERQERLTDAEAARARDRVVRSGADFRGESEYWPGLLRRVPIAGQTAGELFSSGSWVPLPSPPESRAPRAEPTPPPFPFVYLGRSVLDGVTRFFLTRAVPPNTPAGPVFIVSSGETLDGAYRIDSFTDETLVVTYLPLNKVQSLTLAALVAEPAKTTALGTPVSSAMPRPAVEAQALVPQPQAVAPASPSPLVAGPGGAPVGGTTASTGSGFSVAGATGSSTSGSSSGSASSAPGSSSATASSLPAGAAAVSLSSAINPGAPSSSVLGGPPLASGILGSSVSGSGSIGLHGVVAPESTLTGSAATVGPGPIAK
jgi:hypothetical protein